MLKSNKKTTKRAKKIYLDYASAVDPNPSSIHDLGLEAKKKLELARREVAKVLNARPEEIIFTSTGTESNNLAISGIVGARGCPTPGIQVLDTRGGLPHIVTTNIEHPSVLETFRLLEKRGVAEVSIVAVEENGIVDPRKIKKELKENTILVSVMYANNEIGTIQPIEEIAKEIRHFRKVGKRSDLKEAFSKSFAFPFFHTDAVQAVNYLDLNVLKLHVDLLTLSGAKISNAGRVGVLYKRNQAPLSPIMGGGDQEGGLRPGTQNVSATMAFAKALTKAEQVKQAESKRLRKLQSYFLKKLKKLDSEIIINGDVASRLPNNVNITFPNIPSDLLVIELSAKGVMVSSKSACQSSDKEGSYVINALRANQNKEIGAVRFSMGPKTKKEDIDYTVMVLKEILKKLKKWYH